TDNRAAGNGALFQRLESAQEPLAIPIIAVEEQCKGWLAKIHRIRDIQEQVAPYERLAELFELLADWDIVRLTRVAADEFTRLRRRKIRIGTQDLKIASIALTQ